MERNPFDAFDEPQPASASGNPFDAFDATQPVAPPALAVDPAAISNAPPRAELVAPGSIPGSPVSDGAAALGLGTARSIIPAFLGGGAAVATGAGLTATGVGAPVGIPLSIIAAFTAGYGARVGQDKLIPPDEEEQRLARENPTLYNTIPAIATMPLGGGKFGVQNFRDLGTAVSASRAGRLLTDAEKAAAISAGTQVGINAAIPAAARAYNVSQGGEFGVGDYLLELGAAPFVGGKSYRPIQAVQDAASTVGFRVGSGASSAARAAARFAGLRPRPTAAGEVNAPVAQYNGVELVRPEDLPIAVWQQLTDEGRANAVLDARARAAAAAAAQQAAPQPEPTPMSPPRPTQEVLPVEPTATATPEAAPTATPEVAPAPAPAPEATVAPAPEPQRPPNVKPQDWDGFNLETKRLLAEEARILADEQAQAPKPAASRPAATPKPAPAVSNEDIPLTRLGDQDEGGNYYGIEGQTQYEGGERFVLPKGSKVADLREVEVADAVINEALNDPNLAPEQRATLEEARGQGDINYLVFDETPMADAARRLGYDAVRVVENQDMPGTASSVFVLNNKALKPSPKPAPQAEAPATPAKSADRDKAYNDAIGKGDKVSARKALKEQAAAEGFTIGPVYHGTPTGGFNKFDPSRMSSVGGVARGGVSFTTNRAAAEAYSKSFDGSKIDLISKANEIIYQANSEATAYGNKISEGEAGFRSENVDLQPGETLSDFIREYASNVKGDPILVRRLNELADAGEIKQTPEVKEVYLRLSGKPRVVKTTRENMAKDLLNVRATLEQPVIVEMPGETVYYIGNPADIKSASLRVSDDAGSIIPPSRRFKGSDDLRGEVAPAPKPAPTARPAQTEIPGAEDAFNLAPEQTRAPAPEATADTTPDLVQPTEPSYVGPARKRLADLEAQGKGESTEAVGLREVIRGSKPATTPEAAPAAEATLAPQEAAPATKPLKLVAKIGGEDIEVGSLREASVRWMRAVREIEQGGRSLNDPSLEKLYQSGGPRVLDENGNLVGFIADNGTIYTGTRRGANDGKPVYRPTEKDYDAAGYGRPNDVEIDSPPAKLVDKSTPAPKPAAAKPARAKPAPKQAAETPPEDLVVPPAEEPTVSTEPVDVQKARKYIEDQRAKKRPASLAKLQAAKDLVDQYEADQMARDTENRIDDRQLEDVSDETLEEILQDIQARRDNGDEITPNERNAEARYEKEYIRRQNEKEMQEDRDSSYDMVSEEDRVLEQGTKAADDGNKLPRIPADMGDEQMEILYNSVPKEWQRRLFRYPNSVANKGAVFKQPRNKPGFYTPPNYEKIRSEINRMIEGFAESAGSGTKKYDISTTNSDEIISAFFDALQKRLAEKPPRTNTSRRYKTRVEEGQAQEQPPVRDTDEAMPDVEVDEATGATVRTEEVDAVDAAEANLAGRDDTPIGVMPKNLDDGQGGRTLPPDKNGEGGIVKILDDSADDILGKPGEGRMHSVSPPVIAAMVWRTARAMQKGAVDATKGFASWSKGFVKTYGGNFKAYAQYVWDAAKSTYQAGFVNFKPRFLAGIAEKASQIADRNKFSAAAQELNALIFNRPGGKASGEGLGAAARIESAQARVRNKLSALSAKFREKINEMSKSEKVMFNRLVRQIHEGTVPMPKGWVGEYVRDMRDILRNDPDAGLLAQQKVGIEINDAGETYFPRRLDRNRVEAREAEFVAAAAKAYKKQWERLNAKERLELFPELGDGTSTQPVNDAFFEAKAREYYNRVIERITDGDLLPLFDRAEGTKPRVTKERTFNNAEAALLDDFYVDDYLGTIEEYLGSAARRKVSTEVVGPGGEKLADISKRMAAEGVRSKDRQELRELLKKSIGVGRKADSQATAAFFDATGFVQGAALLGRSFWNNLIQEPMQIGIRGSTMPFGLDAPIKILKAYKDTYTNTLKDIARLNPEQARRYRELVGRDPAFTRSLDETLSELLGLNSFNDPSFYARTTGDFGRDATGLPRVRELTNRIFDVNLLSPTEAAKVTASVRAARAFLADNLRFASGQSKLQKLFQSKGIDIGGENTAKLYLKELGVKDADIPSLLKFVDDLDAARAIGGDEAVIKLISSNDPVAAKYRESVTAFSRQSSVKPSRATKPEFQDEGLGRMFLQLKGFSYDFEQSINFRRFSLMREALVGKNYGLHDRAVMAGPLLMAPLTVAGTMAKFALMSMLYPSKGTEKRDKESFAKKAVGAASYEGLFGPLAETALKFERGQVVGGIAVQSAVNVGSAGLEASFGDSKSNAPERRFAQEGYRSVLKPAAGAASTLLPRPVAMAANAALGSTAPEKEFVDTVAGKEKRGSSKDKKDTGRGY